MDELFFLLVASGILASDANPTGIRAQTTFKRYFRVSAELAAVTWDLLRVHKLLPEESQPLHLLWACAFLRHYFTEPVLETITGRSIKTVRTHMWPAIEALAELSKVAVSKHLFFCRCCCCRHRSSSVFLTGAPFSFLST